MYWIGYVKLGVLYIVCPVDSVCYTTCSKSVKSGLFMLCTLHQVAQSRFEKSNLYI